MKMLRLHSIVLIVVLNIFCALMVGTVFGSNSARYPLSDSDFEKIENAIIIHGITREEEPEGESEARGKIIYDDQFAESISTDAKIRPHEVFEKEFNELRKKDNTWHLTRYTIRKGDNLWSIARKFKTDHRLIIKANNISNPDMLSFGKNIVVPNRIGIRHKVLRSETLFSIATRYGIALEKIREQNNIRGSRIMVGTVLFIPDAMPIDRKEGKSSQHRKCILLAKKRDERSRKIFNWPVKGEITSSFGSRISPISGKRGFHTGLDIGCPMDSPVKAAADGKVIFSGWKEIYGNMIILKHTDGYITVYGHNRENLVKEGDVVKAGDVIGKSGTTGASTGPHVHFEIRKHLTPLNPLRFLR